MHLQQAFLFRDDSCLYVISVEFQLCLAADLAGQEEGEDEGSKDGQEPGEAALVERQALYDSTGPVNPCELVQDVKG